MMEEDAHIYDTIILGEDASQFITNEQKTNELKFVDGKLYQKVLTINWGDVITQDERWDLVEGQ